MDFSLDGKQQRLVATIKKFCSDHMSFDKVSQWCRDGGLPDEIVDAFVHLDFEGFGVISRNNRGYYDLFEQVLVLEELAHSCGATLPFPNDFLNLQVMEQFASEHEFDTVRAEYESTGRLMFALAISEPHAGSDAMSMQTRITKDASGRLLLSGEKTFVNNGEYAPYLLVAAIDTTQQISGKYPPLSMWLLPRKLEGIEAYPITKIGQSMLPFSEVRLSDVVLDESYRLHGATSGFPQLFELLNSGRLFSCATVLGLAQAAMDDAVTFARSRSAFGAQISSFQQIQTKLVDMQIKLTSMRMLVYQAAQSLSQYPQSEEARLRVTLAKRAIPKWGTEVASEAMQILGGRGYTDSERVSMIWQDCRGFQIAEGTDEIMVHIAAPLLLKAYESEA